MANLILEFHGLDPNRVPQYTLPVVVDGQRYYYRGGDYGDVVFPVQPQDQQVVAQFLGTSPLRDATGKPLPSPDSFTIAIENGSGLYDQGSKTASALEQLGFRVTSISDTSVGASTTEATILYSNPAHLADALRVQAALSGLTVLGYAPGLTSGPSGGVSSTSTGGDRQAPPATIDVGSALSATEGADVVLVTGSNFVVNTASQSSPSTGATTPSSTSSGSQTSLGGGSSPSATASPLADNPTLAAPTTATEPLQPWDPRSCTPTGGPGP
jgi:hypothetical protein